MSRGRYYIVFDTCALYECMAEFYFFSQLGCAIMIRSQAKYNALLSIPQRVWAKPAGGRGYHRATIVDEIDSGEAFLLRWTKSGWDDSVICARNMRSFDASMGLTRTIRGVRYHDTDMAGGAP
eukprot:11301034-Ditylum_brightwellii.AAC.1